MLSFIKRVHCTPIMSTRPSPAVVLTVDDHPLIRSALREVLSLAGGDVELIEVSDPEAGLAALRERPDIDLAFLDLHFSKYDGLSYVERYRNAAPAVPLIIYTMREDAPTLRRALALGAAGIIPKTHSRELMQRAIELVMQGAIYLPPELARDLSVREPAPAQAPQPGDMTRQQRRILELLAEGLPNKEIASKLGIASSTVKNQLTVVFDKLGVSNRTQAAIAARALLERERAK
jgi:DNA-binding NarL/FixJ family response regulator